MFNSAISQFPKNVLVCNTHGSSYVPIDVKQRLAATFLQDNERLLKNYSDRYITKFLEKYVPKEQLVTAEFSRLLSDPNRAPTADPEFGSYDQTQPGKVCDDLFGKLHPDDGVPVDFNKQHIFKPGKQFLGEEKYILRQKYWQPYHHEIDKKIQALCEKFDPASCFQRDMHDTDRDLFEAGTGKTIPRDGGFEKIIISDRAHKACRKEITEEFAHEVSKSFGQDPLVNVKYYGGYVTRYHGEFYNKNKPVEERRNFMQVELPRHWYVNGDIGLYDEKRGNDTGARITTAMKNLADKYI